MRVNFAWIDTALLLLAITLLIPLGFHLAQILLNLIQDLWTATNG